MNGGLRNSYQIPQRGLEVLCVSLWGSQKPPTRSDIPAKQQALLARMATHNQEKSRKPFPFWGKNFPQ